MTYSPESNLLEIVRKALPLELLPWDQYFATMAETDFLRNQENLPAAKSFFIRKAPFGGSFALAGGITAALRQIHDMRLDSEDFRYAMQDLGHKQKFIDWLSDQGRIRVRVIGPQEGQPFFPNEPIVTVEGPLPIVRIVEGIITESMNFGSLSLSKWSRLVNVVYPGKVLDFSRRRAQNTRKATLYAMLAGCFASSNAEMRRYMDIKIIGTMGHEFIQGEGDPFQAFMGWLAVQPDKPLGLIDTLQTMQIDFPAWLQAVQEYPDAIKAADPPVWGWRNDSGDLAKLPIQQYRGFMAHSLFADPWFRKHLGIVETNEIDEWVAEGILEQIRKAAPDIAEALTGHLIWAAGTQPGTCFDQPSIGGVMKLMWIKGYPCIKLCFDDKGNPGPKTSIPGWNLSALIVDPQDPENLFVLVFPACRYSIKANGVLFDHKKGQEVIPLQAYHPDNQSERITLKGYTAFPSQQIIYDSWDPEIDGFTKNWENPDLDSVPRLIRKNLEMLPWAMKRLNKPETMRLYLTPELYDLRQRMIAQGVLRADRLDTGWNSAEEIAVFNLPHLASPAK